jgi:hypothetical protein
MLTIFVIKRISLDALQKRSGPKEYRYYPRISLYRVSLYRVFTVVKFSFPLCTLYMQYKIKSSGQTAVFRLEWKVIVETQSRISLVNVFT